MNVGDLVLERHLQPSRGGYRIRLSESHGTVRALEVPDLAVDLDALWAATMEGDAGSVA